MECLANDESIAWTNASGIPKGMKLPEWSTDLSLELMARHAISTTILSLSAPAMSFVKEKAEAAALCREVNEYAASVRDQHPTKFGFFATIPSVDDVSACLDEIAYALDVLKADGVTLLTSYGQRYLGHPHFRPLWRELDRRASVVFIHPALDVAAGGELTDPYLPPPIIDFPHETTRTAVHLIISNTIRDHHNCKIILSHGGGTLPYIATRIAHLSAGGKFTEKPADEFMREARSFYYDLALTAYEHPLALLLQFAKPDHVLYGSDFPFARAMTISPQVALLDRCTITDDVDFSIRRGAALKLFPRLCIPQ